ncbi:MAG: MATE family efflux transporter, partial [Alphaproteobacteria bacterium]
MASSSASIDLTKGPIWRLMLKIAVPAAIGMIFNTLYALTDTFFAGEISTAALAGLSMTFPVYILMIAVGAGIGQGATALVSNELGAKNTDGATATIGQALSLSFVFGALVGLFIRTFGSNILVFILPDPELVETGMIYVRAVAFSAP